MKQQDTPISPLRQRMIEDMTMCKLREDTQRDYIRAVKKLEHFLAKPLTAATREDMRRFQLHLIDRTLSYACRMAAKEAGIEKRVTMHLLRHSFATHLLEQRVDIRVIQVLLGHSKLETTTVYTHVATDLLRQVISPLDAVKSLNPDT